MKLLNKKSFYSEFERCCNDYSSLKIAVAWCGNPENKLPFSYLASNKNLIVDVILGVSFNHTHPKAINFFLENKMNVRVFNVKNTLFHPKCYLFSKGNKHALFVGSSNFTYGGFFENIEINFFQEGVTSDQIHSFISEFKKWMSPDYSFVPTTKWLVEYTNSYLNQQKFEKKFKLVSPVQKEESIPKSNWLSKANWKLYLNEVRSRLKENGRVEDRYIDVIVSAKNQIPAPWDYKIFDTLENRRIIGGIKPYGWLGHVAASGHFRKFMVSAPVSEKKKVVQSINEICKLQFPINYDILKTNLEILVNTKHSIKVWSRLLTLLRPDLYCTVASPSVRKNLSKTLGISQVEIVSLDGYIKLLKLIHSTPWYNSKKPTDKKEYAIWINRAAFMDAIYY